MKQRAVVKQDYQIILRCPDGREFIWDINDCYFERKMKRINDRMLECIRHHDLKTQFSLDEPKRETWHVVLVHIESMKQKDWTGVSTDRYDAVRQAFWMCLGKSQHECLEEWKVLEARAMRIVDTEKDL